MNLFENIEKINVPVFVCSSEWRVEYRNRMCKRFTKSPRTNSRFSRVFFDKGGVSFPSDNGGLFICGCIINGVYKTAMMLGYRGYALVIFPSLFDFDILFLDVIGKDSSGFASMIRQALDMMDESDTTADRYGTVEKLRKYIFSSIDNYVTLSMFDTQNRVVGKMKTLYDFFYKNAVSMVNKAGYKVEVDSSELLKIEDGVYVDTAYFSMVLSNLLLLCLAASSDKKCVVKAEFMGVYIRNKISFSCELPKKFKNDGKISNFICCCPSEYMNFVPFEELCRSLCWNLGYSINKDELNVSVYFDTDIDTKMVFRSSGDRKIVSAENVANSIFGTVFSALLR